MARMPIVKYKILEVIRESSNTRTWRLAPADGTEVVQFKPGQFVLVYILDEKGNPGTVRPYSISSTPDERDYIDLTIKDTPTFPPMLDKIGVGGVVGVAGPSGVFTFDENHRDVVFIVGGVGVAGVMSGLRHVIAKKLPVKMVLLYSEKTKDKVIWAEEFEKYQSENKNFNAVITLTRENPDGWTGETGRVDKNMLLKYINGSPLGRHYYLCGTPEMVTDMERILAELGVARAQIKYEKWTGIGD